MAHRAQRKPKAKTQRGATSGRASLDKLRMLRLRVALLEATKRFGEALGAYWAKEGR